MSTGWDEIFDVVVIGSGAAGLTASIVAADAGLKTVLVEKGTKWGGTSAISGGGLWMPANPLMIRDGSNDSLDKALRYMEAVIVTDKRQRAPVLTPRMRNFVVPMMEFVFVLLSLALPVILRSSIFKHTDIEALMHPGPTAKDNLCIL